MATACAFLAVLAVTGVVSSPLGLLLPIVAWLIAFVHAAPLVGFTAGLDNGNVYNLINRVIVFPLFLFSGAFFPVEEMPAVVAAVAKATPTWHGVELARSLARGRLALVELARFAYLVVLGLLGILFARHRFHRAIDV